MYIYLICMYNKWFDYVRTYGYEPIQPYITHHGTTYVHYNIKDYGYQPTAQLVKGMCVHTYVHVYARM